MGAELLTYSLAASQAASGGMLVEIGLFQCFPRQNSGSKVTRKRPTSLGDHALHTQASAKNAYFRNLTDMPGRKDMISKY